ncbi:glycoside hydrolase family 13 protein [Microbacterium gilvum]|uniref:Glycoside hydrolase family 13 protein n=1 Tax=Microbacterium gilvum TaxID=1336204 RepID=A0ABP9AIS5_9MICO
MTELHTPDWLADAIFYQIFPDRFANGDPGLDPEGVVAWDAAPTPDNFFGGDLAGIVSRLDHLVELGVTALYLTPVFEARTNHRYDAVDYFRIDHRLGTLDDFRRFLSAAHDRGIRVVLDGVFNHAGVGHAAFRDIVEREEESRWVNWFSVEGFPVVSHPVPNYRTCSGCWYLPKWNVHNPEVRAHHLAVARHWIAEGIDGWRLDVPYFVQRGFWRQFREVVKGESDDLYIVAEEWRDPDEWLRGDMADGTMNYTLRDLILGFTADGSIDAYAFAAGVEALHARIPEPARPAMLNLLGSHDTERVLTRHGDDVPALLCAYALLFAAQGAPMIYYGDEVGLRGANDPGCRGGMVWDTARWEPAIHEAVVRWTSLRRRLESLRRGAQRVVALAPDVVAVTRAHADEVTVVVVNRGTAAFAMTRDEAERHGLRFVGEDGLRVPGRGSVVSVDGVIE